VKREDAESLTGLVVRVLGLNPGPFTLSGTNTYLIGSGPSRFLIDTGEGKLEYLPLLEKAMQMTGCTEISDIFLTHWHIDHIGGLGQVLSKFPKSQIWKHSPEIVRNESAEIKALIPGAIHKTEGATLKVLYCPGHTSDHCGFLLEEEQAIFTGDCILGSGSSTFSNLQLYLRSLESILAEKPKRLYPGHGPLVDKEEAIGKIQEYIKHRMNRENEIISHLDQKRDWTVESLLEKIYPNIRPELVRGATLNTFLHLQKLQEEGRASSDVQMKVDIESQIADPCFNFEPYVRQMMSTSWRLQQRL